MEKGYIEDLAGLKVKTENVSASLISIIRKYRESSISDIKNSILNNDYVFTCDFSGSSERFAELLKLHDELLAAGYRVSLYDEGEESSIEYFRNWLDSMRDTDEFIDSDDSFCDEDNE